MTKKLTREAEGGGVQGEVHAAGEETHATAVQGRSVRAVVSLEAEGSYGCTLQGSHRQHGPLKGAKQPLKSEKEINVSKWKAKSIEYLVVQKRFRQLFNEKEIKEARERLAK
jgi:hypothetical protein